MLQKKEAKLTHLYVQNEHKEINQSLRMNNKLRNDKSYRGVLVASEAYIKFYCSYLQTLI